MRVFEDAETLHDYSLQVCTVKEFATQNLKCNVITGDASHFWQVDLNSVVTAAKHPAKLVHNEYSCSPSVVVIEEKSNKTVITDKKNIKYYAMPGP